MAEIELSNVTNVKFKDLLDLATQAFGMPRIRGSYHVFKTPRQGQPWVNLQKDGSKAKPYQVKQVREALKKLEDYKIGVK